MAIHKNLLITPTLALILASVSTIAVGVTVSSVAQAETKKLTSSARYNVREKEEKRIAKKDRSYRKQNKAMSKHYRKLAQLVKKQGGDPTALIQAAAHFDKK